jgi:hypothetical protein
LDGSGWWGGMGSFASSPLDVYHVVEMESDGVNWWIRVLEEDGTLITQTDPAPWSDVYGLTDDLWFYWGEVYTDQYWGLQRSDWLYLRPSTAARQRGPNSSTDGHLRHHTQRRFDPIDCPTPLA